VKRVICGLSPDGPATVIAVEEFSEPFEENSSRGPGLRVKEIWATDEPTLATEDLTARPGSLVEMPVGATRFRLVALPGGEAGADLPMGMVRTDTIDYCFVLKGEIDVVMEDGTEVSLFPGDSIVQLGGAHRWRRRIAEPTTLVAFATGVERPKGVEPQ
jgi:hypothetical protein